MNKTVTTILIGLLACACTKDIEYRGSDSGPILVANSMNRAGDTAYLRLTRSTFFLEPRTAAAAVTDADVSMTIDGVSRRLTYDSETMRYADVRTLQPGSVVSISASHPEYGSITATDTVPQQIEWEIDTFYRPFAMNGVSIDTIYYQGLDIGSIDSVCVFDLSLLKGESSNRYFQLEFDPYSTVIMWNGITTDTIHLPLSYRLPTGTMIAVEMLDTANSFIDMMDLIPVICTGAHSFTFTDRQLADTTHFEFEILRESMDSLFNMPTVRAEFSVRYSVRSMSLSTYTYQKSVRKFMNQSGIMSEPVTLWTNIQGDGTGILGTYVERRDSMSLARY